MRMSSIGLQIDRDRSKSLRDDKQKNGQRPISVNVKTSRDRSKSLRDDNQKYKQLQRLS